MLTVTGVAAGLAEILTLVPLVLLDAAGVGVGVGVVVAGGVGVVVTGGVVVVASVKLTPLVELTVFEPSVALLT